MLKSSRYGKVGLNHRYQNYKRDLCRFATDPLLDPKEKWIVHQYFTCEMCGEEAIAVPDPTSKYLRIAHCFNCLAEYTVHYCLRCENSYVSFLKEWEKQVDVSSYPGWVNSVDDEADSFCELCSDWIDEQ